MTNTIFNFACFLLWYNFFYITVSLLKMLYDWAYHKPPLSFLEVWIYFEDKFQEMQKVVEEENKDTRKKLVDSLWNSEERSLEHFKDELKKLKK